MRISDLMNECVDDSKTQKQAERLFFRRLKQMDTLQTPYPKGKEEFVEVSGYFVPRMYRRKGNVGKNRMVHATAERLRAVK